MSTRIAEISDLFSSTSPPAYEPVTASDIGVHANDAAFVTAKESAAADGDIYYNTTLDRIRYYENGSWVSLISETSQLAALKAFLGDDFRNETEFALADNQATTDVTGLVFAGASYRSVWLEVEIRRFSTAGEHIANGIICLQFKAGSWLLEEFGWAGDATHGVTLTVTAAGQVQYATTAQGGTSYKGTLKYRAKTFSLEA